jgi:hypothetical protein
MMMNNYMPQGYPEPMGGFQAQNPNPNGFPQYGGVYNDQSPQGQQNLYNQQQSMPPPGFLPEQQLQIDSGYQYYLENQHLYANQSQPQTLPTNQLDLGFRLGYGQRNLELMQQTNFSDQNTHEASKFQELIDTDMQRELDQFRKDFTGLKLEDSPHRAQVYSTAGSQPQGHKNPGVFAEALFGLSSAIQQST